MSAVFHLDIGGGHEITLTLPDREARVCAHQMSGIARWLRDIANMLDRGSGMAQKLAEARRTERPS